MDSCIIVNFPVVGKFTIIHANSYLWCLGQGFTPRWLKFWEVWRTIKSTTVQELDSALLLPFCLKGTVHAEIKNTYIFFFCWPVGLFIHLDRSFQSLRDISHRCVCCLAERK